MLFRPTGSPLRIAALVLLNLAWAATALAQPENLEPTGYINDFAGRLSEPVKTRLEALAVELRQKTGAEAAVAIVESLGGDTEENFANVLAERWGVGDQDDRGALLLIAVEERRLRLEVGYGLEPLIPDGRAGEILDGMTPLLGRGDFDAAVASGFVETAQIIAADAGVALSGVPTRRSRRQRDDGVSLGPWLPLVFILPFLLLPRRRRRGRWGGSAITTAWLLGQLGGMGRGGGLGGFGGGGGGGFGGFGGGSYGGGGASRGW